MAATAGSLMIIWVLLGLLIAILWILMPFAIFGTKPILRSILAEQKRTNDLLQAQLDQQRSVSTVRGREPGEL